jgi:hypothetical protein
MQSTFPILILFEGGLWTPRLQVSPQGHIIIPDKSGPAAASMAESILAFVGSEIFVSETGNHKEQPAKQNDSDKFDDDHLYSVCRKHEVRFHSHDVDLSERYAAHLTGRLHDSACATRPEGFCASGLIVVQTFGTARNVNHMTQRGVVVSSPYVYRHRAGTPEYRLYQILGES